MSRTVEMGLRLFKIRGSGDLWGELESALSYYLHENGSGSI